MHRWQLEATGDEPRAVHAGRPGAHGRIVGETLGRGGNIAGSAAGGDRPIERCRIIETAPFIGNADIRFAGDPPAVAPGFRPVTDVRSIDLDSRRIPAVQDIPRERPPRMPGINFRDRQSFRRRDLRRRERVAGKKRRTGSRLVLQCGTARQNAGAKHKEPRKSRGHGERWRLPHSEFPASCGSWATGESEIFPAPL